VSTETKQETAVEDIKRSSNYLRGEIGRELDNDVASVSNESEQILKFHGVYAQDNRDVRRERALNKEEPISGWRSMAPRATSPTTPFD
jgi:sulfite reductase beta subunit-like hemoprotein